MPVDLALAGIEPDGNVMSTTDIADPPRYATALDELLALRSEVASLRDKLADAESVIAMSAISDAAVERAREIVRRRRQFG